MDALLERTFHAERRHFWFRGFRRFVVPLIERATQGLSSARLLDAGCGTGGNLAMLGRFGSAHGLELMWSGLNFARQLGLPRLTQGSVTDLPYADASMDVVVSFDVLYCLPDQAERAALAEMFRVLRPGGWTIVNVAALDMLKGDHSVLGGEVRRYTRRQLREKLERAGFTVTRITYTNASLVPVIATVRALQRLRGLKSVGDGSGDLKVPAWPVNALFTAVLAVESMLLSAGLNMPVGSSVLCLATKPAL